MELSASVLLVAQQQYPSDYRINVALSHMLAFDTNPRRTKDAVGFARAAVAVHPESAAARATLGSRLYADGQFEEAVTQCKESLRISPQDSWTIGILIDALIAQGKVSEIIEEAQLNPDLRDIAYAKYFDDLTQNGGTIPSSIASHNPYVHYLSALGSLRNSASEYRQKCKNAVRLFGTSSNVDDLDWTAWSCALGRMTFEDRKELTAFADHAKSALNGDRRSLQSLGGLQFRLGRFAEAEQSLRACLAQPDDANLPSAYA
jgi:Flp pilus assembly protein TadD